MDATEYLREQGLLPKKDINGNVILGNTPSFLNQSTMFNPDGTPKQASPLDTSSLGTVGSIYGGTSVGIQQNNPQGYVLPEVTVYGAKQNNILPFTPGTNMPSALDISKELGVPRQTPSISEMNRLGMDAAIKADLAKVNQAGSMPDSTQPGGGGAGDASQYMGLPSTYEYDIPSALTQMGQGIYNASHGQGGVENTVFNIAAPILKTLTSGVKGALTGYTNAKMSEQIRRSGIERRDRQQERATYGMDRGGIAYANGTSNNSIRDEGIGFATGEFAPTLTGNNEDEANVFASAGEFMITPDGSVKEIKGDRHKYVDGEAVPGTGTPLNVESGTAFIGNDEIGSELARSLRYDYGLNVKAKDSYAKVAEKYKAKIGLSKVYEEQKSYFDRLEKNDKLKDENTKGLNKQVLSKKIKDIEAEITPLEDDFKNFSYNLFNKQELAKDTEEQRNFFESGGVSFTNDMISTFANKHNMSLSKARELIYSNRKLFDGGGLYFDQQDNSFRPQYNNEFGHQSATGSGYGDVNANTREDRLKELARLFPKLKSGDSPILIQGENGKVSIAEGKTTKDLQSKIQSIYDSTKNLGDKVGNKDAFTKFFEENGFVDQKGNVRSFDNMLGNFTSTRPAVRMRAVSDEQLKALNDKGIYNLSEAIGSDEARQILGNDYSRLEEYAKTGADTDFFLAPYTKEDIAKGTTTPVVESKVATVPKDAKTDTAKGTGKGDLDKVIEGANERPGGYMRPQQYVSPPTPLSIPALQQVGYTPIEAMQLDIPYADIYGAADMALSSLNTLADPQRAAIAASIGANAAENINKAYANIAPQNVQSRLQADAYNAAARDRAESTNVNLQQYYDQNVGTARAKTEEENRNYLEMLSRINMAKFKDEQQLDLLGNLYEQFGVDASGNIAFKGTSPAFQEDPMIKAQRVKQEEDARVNELLTKAVKSGTTKKSN